MDLEVLANARKEVVTARADLRFRADTCEMERSLAERRIIEMAGGDPKALGSNEADRRRNLVIETGVDVDYCNAVESLRQAETRLDEAQANLEILLDARREFEWAVRVKMGDTVESAYSPEYFQESVRQAARAILAEPLGICPRTTLPGHYLANRRLKSACPYSRRPNRYTYVS